MISVLSTPFTGGSGVGVNVGVGEGVSVGIGVADAVGVVAGVTVAGSWVAVWKSGVDNAGPDANVLSLSTSAIDSPAPEQPVTIVTERTVTNRATINFIDEWHAAE